MKKYLLLLLLLCPFSVFADSYTIQTKVGLEGKELEEGEFTFNLLDKDGNIVQTKNNDKDGNVIFYSIEWNTNGITTWIKNDRDKYVTTNDLFQIYTIKQADNGIKGYTLDNEITYVMVSNNGKKVTYLKYPSDERIASEKKKYEWNPYHASDSELQGVIYVESDLDTHVVRVFRDEAGKYTDNQHIGNKIYSIMSESLDSNYVLSSVISNDYSGWREQIDYIDSIKKIIIEDPIRPPSGEAMFYGMRGLEEIVGLDKLDTSKMISMSNMFEKCNKLKTLDLTHFDFSGLTSQDGLNHLFILDSNSESLDEYELKIAGFNIPAGIDTKDMFIYNKGIDEYTKVITNFDWFNNTNLSNQLRSDGTIIDYDNNRFRYFFKNSNVDYFDLSNLKLHIYNNSTSPTGRGGLNEFISCATGYYFDISNITTDYCAYSSSDIRINVDNLRILKISDQNSSKQGLVIKNGSIDPIYLYNVDSNIVSSELTEFYGGTSYLISDPNSYSTDDCDRYYHGGTWLNIADPASQYLNEYAKGEVRGIEDNPKTGIIKYTMFIIVIIAICAYFLTKTKKQTYFDN